MTRLLLICLVVLFSLLWSSAFVVGTIALTGFPPAMLLALRFAASATLLFPFAFKQSGLLRGELIRNGLLLGGLNNVLYLWLSFTALRMVRPEVVIVIISCAPFVTTALSVCLKHESFSIKISFGMILGFIGVVVISGLTSSQEPNLPGIGAATLGMLAFSAATVMFKKTSAAFSIVQINFWQFVAGTVVLLPCALLWGPHLHRPSMASILALLYLIVVVSIGAMALWLLLIRTSGAASASSYHLLNPFFGVLLSFFVLGKALHISDFIGAMLIASGLLLTTSKEKFSRVIPKPRKFEP